MSASTRVIGWLCVPALLWSGCYSAEIIDPSGSERRKIYSEEISAVVTRDGKRIEFDKPARLVSAVIIGGVKGTQVSIPLSECVQVQVPTIDSTRTIFLVGLVAGVGLTLLWWLSHGYPL